jgi:hypothetical protein
MLPTQNIGIELMFENAIINKTEQEIKELFINYTNNNPELQNIINNGTLTINTNSINLLLTNIYLTDTLKNIWNEFTDLLKQNKTQLTMDILGIDEITNQRLLYLSPIYNSELEINCNIIGCSVLF